MASPKFDNKHLVKENGPEVLARMFEIIGSNRKTDLAKAMGRSDGEIGNWTGSDDKRSIPLEFVVDFCIKHDVSIDYVLRGVAAEQKIVFVGDPSVSMSPGAQQISGSALGPGVNVLSAYSGGGELSEELAEVVDLLKEHGSRALVRRIKEMILKVADASK